MKMYKSFLAFACLSYCSFTQAQQSHNDNPLLIHSDKPLRFDKIDAAAIANATTEVIKLSDTRVEKIISMPAEARSISNTLMAFDELLYDINELSLKLSLIASTYQDDSTRNAANDDAGKISVYSNNLYLNEGLYKAIKDFSALDKGKQLKPNEAKFLKETIIVFEKNGMKLDSAARKELEALNTRLINYGIEFDKNIAESKDSVEFTESELAGLPDNTKAPWKRSGSKYIVTINGPNLNEILSKASNDATRKTIYLHYNNRAYPKNIRVLDSLFYYRQLYANKLGFKSYASYVIVDKMAASPGNVWKFENDLVTKLTPHVTREIIDMKTFKHSINPNAPDTLYEWDVSYYKKKLLDTKYRLNTDTVKAYFEINNTLKGMFNVYERLFDIDIKELKNVALWYSKVKPFEMYKDGKKIGSFYLDLFPRPNKYTHFACFPISQYRKANGKEVLPVASLICNFPEGNINEPSLLYHADVVTLFHEFGHLVHALLSRSDIVMQGPFFVKGDFVEAPSQFLENWVWEYESLKLFARHYKTGETLPKSLYNKMKETRKVGVATNYIRQSYYGMLDLTYEDKYDSLKGKDLVQVSKELSSILQMPFPEGAHFIANFTHLNGYAANYYGYLWSKVFAEDMFSVFKKNGIMDTRTGISYRKNILEKGSSIDEMGMLRSFLGREPNSDAFLEALGIN